MQTSNLWNKQYIYRKEIALLIFFLTLFSLTLVAQERKTYGMTRGTNNLPNYDNKSFHYGFTIGLNSAGYIATPSSVFLGTDTILSVTPRNSGGFSLGFIVNARLGEFFDLRLMPTVAFYERKLEYNFKLRGNVEQLNDNTFIEFPLLLKYKSQKRKNVRMYMVGGIKPGIEAGSKKKDKKANQLRTNNIDFSVDYGFGFDIYYPLFKFSPEIRISHGFVNMLNSDPNEYALSLNRLLTHTITLYLHFE